jgi:hypothetical protein
VKAGDAKLRGYGEKVSLRQSSRRTNLFSLEVLLMRHPTAPFAFALIAAAAACSAGESPVDPGLLPGVPSTVAVSVSAPTLKVGQTAEAIAVVRGALGEIVAGAPVSWVSENPALVTVSSTGVVTAVAAGTARLRGSTGALSDAATIVVTDPPSPLPTTPSWTFCAAGGAMCDFAGLRDVRLGAANGPYVEQQVYHSVPCASFAFRDRDPAPGLPLHCDYGPIKLASLSNPMPGMGGLGATVVVPLGSEGASGPQNKPTTEVPVVTDGTGSFRTTCSLASFAFDDPIVYPGRPNASHLHVFFGNTAINAGSTPRSVASSGSSTCRGGTLNRTGYWMPALFDSRAGEIQTPDEAVFYYKTGYNTDPKSIKPIPADLRMIAGDKLATSKQEYVEWYCRDANTPPSGSIPTNCRVGDAVRLAIQFPQCWDGQNLDSPDHKSHMAYPIIRNPPQLTTCPSTHPVMIPVITEHFDFPITSTSAPAYWRLSSDMYATSLAGGFSAHADWMGGWDKETMNTIVTQCLHKAVDCGVGSIGNGTVLY